MKKHIKSLAIALIIPFFSTIAGDNRTKFNDHSKRSPRVVKSPIIQFYSSVDNIGNYLPVMAIHEMLGQRPDTWCAHATIDWDFVNKNYKCGIIGGAGLFHGSFEPFWKRLNLCKIPLIIWGVGICLPSKDPHAVDKEIIKKYRNKFDLIDIRDEATAEYYDFTDVSITACPCIVYLQKYRKPEREIKFVLYSHHEHELSNNDECKRIIDVLKDSPYDYRVINNFQRPDYGIEQYIQNYYLKSKVVVTTRLHGAIIAYALGIPYIIIPHDIKLVEFHRKFGNGWIAKNTKELKELLHSDLSIELKPIDLEPLLKFAERAKVWVERQCN